MCTQYESNLNQLQAARQWKRSITRTSMYYHLWLTENRIKYTNRHKRFGPLMKTQLRTFLIFICGCIFSALVLSIYSHSQYVQRQMINTTALQQYDESLATYLAREVRIICMVLTCAQNHEENVRHIRATWGRRCTKLIFVSSQADDELGIAKVVEASGDTYDDLWNKTREGFRFVYENYINEYDWFLKADDDTYVIMENLRQMLYAYSDYMPVYFGYKMMRYDVPYMSGGASYVLSRETLRRFMEKSFDNERICPPAKTYSAEDFYISICLQNVGVHLVDTKYAMPTETRGLRSFPLSLNFFTSEMDNFPEWMHNMSAGKINFGLPFCCSSYPIAFHYLTGRQMYEYEYLIYQLRVYGSVNSILKSNAINKAILAEQLPKRFTWSEVEMLFPRERNEQLLDLSAMSDKPDNF